MIVWNLLIEKWQHRANIKKMILSYSFRYNDTIHQNHVTL
jgi:hypothetical protein